MTRGLPSGYSLHVGYPPAAEYCNLRKTSGLAPVSLEQAQAVPTGSWYGCMIKYSPQSSVPSGAVLSSTSNGSMPSAVPGSSEPWTADSKQPDEIVAMGRVIGDGGWYFVIADMAVLPAHQRKGLGDYVLNHLVEKIKSTPVVARTLESGGPLPFINMLADAPGRKLYERNGFVYTAPHSLGMMLKLD